MSSDDETPEGKVGSPSGWSQGATPGLLMIPSAHFPQTLPTGSGFAWPFLLPVIYAVTPADVLGGRGRERATLELDNPQCVQVFGGL
jgi:hypothetical protein